MPRKSFEVDIEPEILVWARESIGMDTAEAAKRFNLSENTIKKWESGQKKPTIVQIKKLAGVYRRPLAAFFLPEPPEELPLPHDFRTLPDERRKPFSSKTRLAIRQARRLQSLATELAENTDEIHPDVGRASLSDDPEIVANNAREKLGINIQTQFSWKKDADALKEWRKCIEGLGVLVFQFSLPVEETRGFSLPDDTFPAIVLNGKDHTRARIFSLFHEYGHLLLDTGGICNWENQHGTPEMAGPIERFCNHFAGAFLVPRHALLTHTLVESRTTASDWSDDCLREIAADFKVSREVILRRLSTFNLATWSFYRVKHEQWKEEAKEKQKPQKCIRENSIPFVSLVLESYRKEKITYNDVADYLGIRTKHIPKVENLIEAGV